MIAPFEHLLASVSFNKPQRMMASTVLGTWASDELATPEYWVKQLTSPVRFAQAIDAIAEQAAPVLVDIGPRQVLSALVQRGGNAAQHISVVPLAPQKDNENEAIVFESSCAVLQSLGYDVGPTTWEQTEGRRINVPAHPFQRNRCWIDSDDSKPRTTNTKIDRLPLLLETLTGQSDLQATQSFAELGLDSLSLTGFGVTVQREFGVALSLS